VERDILYGQGDGYTLQLLPVNPKALLNGCVDDIQFSGLFQQIGRRFPDTHKKELPSSHAHSRSIQQTKQAALETRNIVGILFSKIDTTIAKQFPTLHHRTQTTV
jgi:hypothetical protein